MTNGRTDAEDMEREYQRSSLRDTFAAAALTGLLAQGDDGSFSEESYARAAYRWADTMLREREQTAARASGSGSVTPVSYEKNDEKRVFYDTKSPRNGAPHSTPSQGSVQGEGSVPRSGTENEPVAWAVTIGPAGKTEVYEAFAAHQKDEAIRLANQCRFGNAAVKLPLAPLYFAATLTTEERASIETAALALADLRVGQVDVAATLRKLLERLA